MRRVIGWWVLCCGLAIVACSSAGDGTDERGGDDPPSGGDRNGDGTSSNAGDGDGDGAAGAGSPGPGLGNSGPITGLPSDTMPMPGDDDPLTPMAPDEEPVCGGTQVEPMITMEVVPGNVLLVYDNSGSMDRSWSAGSNPKWIDAQRAIRGAVEPLADRVRVASVFFPLQSECGVPAHDAAPQIGFLDGPAFLTQWDAFWSTTIPEGRTPLRAALQVADQALAASTLPGTTRVVIVTDGQPNCSSGGRGDEPVQNLTPLLTTWAAAGVRTHVVGLPDGDGGGAPVALLDGLAMAGDTGVHIPASDPATLQSELAAIIGESVTTGFTTCRIGLPSVPPNLDDVNLVVTEEGVEQSVARDLGAGGGWSLTPDAREIVLQGNLCEHARVGTYERISVVFGCVQAPPLPPPDPVIPT